MQRLEAEQAKGDELILRLEDQLRSANAELARCTASKHHLWQTGDDIVPPEAQGAAALCTQVHREARSTLYQWCNLCSRVITSGCRRPPKGADSASPSTARSLHERMRRRTACGRRPRRWRRSGGTAWASCGLPTPRCRCALCCRQHFLPEQQVHSSGTQVQSAAVQRCRPNSANRCILDTGTACQMLSLLHLQGGRRTAGKAPGRPVGSACGAGRRQARHGCGGCSGRAGAGDEAAARVHGRATD